MSITLRKSLHSAIGIPSCGGAVDNKAAGVISNNSALNSVFDKVLKHENIAGTTDYRLLYLSNDTSENQKVYNPQLKLLSTTDTEISLGPLSKNEVGAAILTENTVPQGVFFKTQEELKLIDEGYLSFNNAQQLAPGEFVGVWIKRRVNSSSGSGTVKEEIVLEVKYKG